VHLDKTHISTPSNPSSIKAEMALFAKSWIALSTSAIFLWFVFLASAPFLRHVDSYLEFLASTREASETSPFHAPHKNVWADLSQHEAEGLLKFLFDSPALNLTEASKATRCVFRFEIIWNGSDDLM